MPIAELVGRTPRERRTLLVEGIAAWVSKTGLIVVFTANAFHERRSRFAFEDFARGEWGRIGLED